MRVIDSSTLIYCFSNGIELNGIYYVIGDLDEEFQLAELIHQRERVNVEPATSLPSYNEAFYLRQYVTMLNKHAGYSFTAMRGFGDVAILALVRSYLENFGQPKQASLFDEEADLPVIVTDDKGLTKRAQKEFGNVVTYMTSNDINNEGLSI